MPNPARGEVWQVDLGLAAKVRPAVVMSVPFLDSERALFAIVPHTTAIRGSRFEATFPVPSLEAGAFDAQGLRNVPGSVFVRKRASLSTEQLDEGERAIKRGSASDDGKARIGRTMRFSRDVLSLAWLNGKKFTHKLQPSLGTLCRTLIRRGDPELAFTAELKLPLSTGNMP